MLCCFLANVPLRSTPSFPPPPSSPPLPLPTRLNLSHHRPILIFHKKPLKVSALTSRVSIATSSSNPSPHIRRLCRHGHLEQALLLLESTTYKHLDDEAYISLIQLCERRRATENGYRIYSHLYSHFSKLSLRLGNFLLAMLAKFGDIDHARKVFDEMPHRDDFSWSAMLSGCVKVGLLGEALERYGSMLRAGGMPNVYIFPCVLKACGDFGDPTRASAVHAHVLRFGFGSYVDVLTSLVSTYIKCVGMENARKVFDNMPSRPPTSWGVLAVGYLKHDMCAEVLELFRIMRDQSVVPNLFTMTAVIKASWVVGDESLGKVLHGYVMRTFLGEAEVYNSLLKMYFSFGDVESSEKLFLDMPSRDLVTWNIMVSGYEKNGLPEDAIGVFQKMESQGLVPDKSVVTSVLAACASTRNVELGTKLHNLAMRRGLLQSARLRIALINMHSKCNNVDKALEVFRGISEKSVIAWTSMLGGLRDNGRSFEALNLFRQMVVDLKPNCVALLAALSTCADVGALMCGKEIHGHALRSGLASDEFLPNGLLDLYAKCGTLELTRRQFISHENKDVVSFTILLNACARYEAFKHGKELHANTLRTGLAFEGFLSTSLLYLYAMCGRMELARRQFELLEEKDVVSWTIMLSGYRRHGVPEQVRGFSELMEEAGLNPRDYQGWKDFLDGNRVEEELQLWGSWSNGHSRLKEDINFKPYLEGTTGVALEPSRSPGPKSGWSSNYETETGIGDKMMQGESNPQKIDYSGAEICADLEGIGIELHLLPRAYVYLTRNPDMMKAYLECPPSLRKQVILEMIGDTKPASGMNDHC